MAEVNDKGEVTVEGEFVGRLEGFRFSQDKSASPEEAKTLRAAAVAALAPQFHLRADRFYNAPDTELDFTEQGGLMWGEHAVGKLVKGDDILKPRVQPFVDDEAGGDVADKVARRLQHFIDRKVAAQFEPLIALSKDETLPGLARGFAFRLVEALGVLPRAEVAHEVKELDQEARGLLRKHGVRFGQFTIFMPLLLKPAPTRLRLVLWSLAGGLDEFPEAPPPGLVTIPTIEGADARIHTLAGYRVAGARAIRIDMLERLADQLRSQNSRTGFEANPDMLSITGMTLEQFADLMQGLGYKAERGERAKIRAVAEDPTPTGTSEAEAQPGQDVTGEAEPGAAGASEIDAMPTAETPEEPATLVEHPEGASGAASVEAQPGSDTAASAHPGDAGASEVQARATPEDETEVFYTFTWGGLGGGKPRGRGKPRAQGDAAKAAKPRGKGKPRGTPRKDDKPASFSSRPPKKDRIDPDNPFAQALMGLKDKT